MRLIVFLSLVSILVNAADAVQPLPLELPKPAVAGTPKPIKVSNLEPVRVGPRVLPTVPVGAKNLALGKAVTTSARDTASGDISYVTDGDKAGDEGFEVELPRGIQWAQIDLGASATIDAVAIWHFHRERRVYLAVAVQVSDDATFKSGVTTIFNNDDGDKLGFGKGTDLCYIESHEGKVIAAKGVKGRYVRLYSNGNSSTPSNDYVEVEVWGVPVK
ncbi:MAG TPA: hypothetical protein DCY41_02935 [Opitutae bacterium]|nr:hypothetical protein [Opitutae bacterium]